MPLDGKLYADQLDLGGDWDNAPFDHIMTVTTNDQIPGGHAFLAGSTLKLTPVVDTAADLPPAYYVFCRQGDDGGPLAPVVGRPKARKRHGYELAGWPRQPAFVRLAEYPLVYRVVGYDPGRVLTHRAQTFPRAAVPIAWESPAGAPRDRMRRLVNASALISCRLKVASSMLLQEIEEGMLEQRERTGFLADAIARLASELNATTEEMDTRISVNVDL